ncbi:MAG: DNA-3-methyladenine glycosylase family protein [Candidatus Puniceispirillaceae bacterium]
MTDMHHKLHVDAGGGEGGALAALARLDPDIAAVLKRYGAPPDRSLPAGFETLARAVVGQQVSRAAASSIWRRMEADGVTDISGVSGASLEELMAAGLSRRKAEYLTGIAEEIGSGRLNIEDLKTMSGGDVQRRLVAIRGVGAWTADNFRLFALADMDAWPVKDVALQEAMKILKSLPTRPTAEEMEILGDRWMPFRGAGALVLWHLYAVEVRKVTLADI